MDQDRPAGPGLRDRFRAQVREETKQEALRQLADGGPAALSLNAIAKHLGVSGPALYRYFANRDSLLTELIIDAYHDLAAALDEARRRPPGGLRPLVRAYRAWAVAEPHRYRLLFRAPLPGYDAHAERLVEASRLAMRVVVDVVVEVARDFPPVLPAVRDDRLAAQLERWARRHDLTDVPTGAGLAATALWAWLHGLVSLEIEGNFASMGLDPAPLYDADPAGVVAALTA
ncbi:TetR/AcrR family transcriptional regulator [Streptosporangiaceae bacterium NEAU-GS5]|nr:TetR/AcrR family transcriptional regulator [Streptosporangiaceae bacterium NEAU-GS5]